MFRNKKMRRKSREEVNSEQRTGSREQRFKEQGAEEDGRARRGTVIEVRLLC
jgi:hypothetical protein